MRKRNLKVLGQQNCHWKNEFGRKVFFRVVTKSLDFFGLLKEEQTWKLRRKGSTLGSWHTLITSHTHL